MKQKVEDIYKKVTQVEHVLLRPDTYIGSIEVNQDEYWVWDQEGGFQKRDIEISQGLYKIFDEILVNAADNFQRDKTGKQMTVVITPHQIIVENDGKGIPVQIHKELGVYVPQMIFGHLLTSSNYDDTQKKVTGGRNGFGAKLTNIFSKKFTLETADKHKLFEMTWTDNMSKHTEAAISENKGSQFTRITFRPDFSRFKMAHLSEDMIQLLNKRVADMAGILGPSVKVTLNGKRVPITGFREFIKMFNIEKYVFSSHDSNGRRWDVAVSHSDGQLNQVSFVNSINTVRGGSHVNHVVDQITEGLMNHIKKKHKDFKNIKPFQIKAHLFVFVNCLIENPSFDSQTKETLITKPSEFGSRFELTEKFLDEIIKKTEVVNNVVLSARSKLDSKMAKQLTGKKQSRILGIEKLEDANDAGTKYADQCTLILTEGDSAKSLAMAGIEIVGRDRYGVFPLRGKLLNVRDASSKQIMENKEIEYVVKILGLKFNQQYETTKNLRYGSVMIMTDQDHDGHHIKGLIINLFDKFWPSLLKHKGFLKQFITPILKATYKTQQVGFFSIGEYKQWKDSIPNAHLFKIKYYKGLGTSTDQEGQQYFSQLNKHVKPFKYVDQTDQDYIDLVFNKTKADARKDWLLTYSWKTMMDTLDYTQAQVRYKNFITDCLALYSVSDNIRSLPSQIDGLKPTQRKILFTLLTHNKQEYKVSSLSGMVSTHTNYHHGEVSLQTTVVTMAQSFTGANNINLLMPLGQFGTRAQGGKDAASARYIFTKLSPVTTKLFIEEDLHTYQYLEEEGSYAEPIYFAPIIPMVLVNGSEGIGTGWSTNVPQYNPREIVNQIKQRMLGKQFDELTPWYKGFTGQIIFNACQNSFTQRGKYIKSGNVLFVVEIPVRKATKEFQSFLQTKMESDDNQPDIIDLKEYHAGNKVCFEIHFREGFLEHITDDALEKYLKLNAQVSLNNLVLFDQTGILKRHNGTAEIMEDFFNIRLNHYNLRKDYLISKIQNQLDVVENKINFLEGQLNNTINIRNMKKKDMIALLLKHKLKNIENMTKIVSTKPKQKKVKALNDEVDENEEQQDHKSFDYLLGMPFWSFSEESITKMKQEQKLLQQNLSILQRQSVHQMWNHDLDEFLLELDKQEHEEEEEHYKRLEKNAEKLFKGGSKMIRQKTSTQSFNESDGDDSEDDQPKKKPKIMMQVIKEFGNLGLTSKRPLPEPIQLQKSKKKQMEEEVNDIDLDLGDDLENGTKQNGKKEKAPKEETKSKKTKIVQNIEDSHSAHKQSQIKKTKTNQKNHKKNINESDDDFVDEEIPSSSKKNRGGKKVTKHSDSGSMSYDDVSEQIPKKSARASGKRKLVNNDESDDEPKYSDKKTQQAHDSEVEDKKQSKRMRIIVDDSEEEVKQPSKQVNSKVSKTKKKITKADQQKENHVTEDPAPHKKLKREDEQLYEKYGLGQFMKYLTDDIPTTVNSKTSNDPTMMTLAERLLLRQREGNIDHIKQSYEHEKGKIDSAKQSVQRDFNIFDVEFD